MSLLSEKIVTVVESQQLVADQLYVNDISALTGVFDETIVNNIEVNGTTTQTVSTLNENLSITNTSVKTYPSINNFTAYPGIKLTVNMDTNQTINPTTPGGFFYVYPNLVNLQFGSANSVDVEGLYFTIQYTSFTWNDPNTCTQYIGDKNEAVYSGINANGRTTSALTCYLNQNISLNGNNNVITVNEVLNGETIRIVGTPGAMYNIGNMVNYQASLLFDDSQGASTATLAEHVFYDVDPAWGSYWTTPGSLITITNLYGINLKAPQSSSNLTITNNWGIYSGWDLAKNYFAGQVGIGTTAPGASAALQINSTTQGFLPPRMSYAQADAIANKEAGLLVFVNDITGAPNPPFDTTGWFGWDGAAWVKW